MMYTKQQLRYLVWIAGRIHSNLLPHKTDEELYSSINKTIETFFGTNDSDEALYTMKNLKVYNWTNWDKYYNEKFDNVIVIAKQALYRLVYGDIVNHKLKGVEVIKTWLMYMDWKIKKEDALSQIENDFNFGGLK